MRTLALITLLATACSTPGDEAEPDLSCDGEGDSLVLLVRRLTFSRQETTGVSEGFDLDNFNSQRGDDEGCGVADLVDPNGVPGIDNAISTLLPIIESTEAAAVEPLIQDSIFGGALLLMAELSDLDDPANDECVDVSVFKGTGVPMIGADGEILPYQTLRVDPASLGNGAPANPLVDGTIDAGPIQRVAMPVQVLDLNTTLELFNTRLRAAEQPDGTWKGQLGGGIGIQQLIDTVTLQNVDPAVFAAIGPALALVADLAPDETGACQQISVSFDVELVPAFVYEGE
jgi:hypothetical protein